MIAEDSIISRAEIDSEFNGSDFYLIDHGTYIEYEIFADSYQFIVAHLDNYLELEDECPFTVICASKNSIGGTDYEFCGKFKDKIEVIAYIKSYVVKNSKQTIKTKILNLWKMLREILSQSARKVVKTIRAKFMRLDCKS